VWVENPPPPSLLRRYGPLALFSMATAVAVADLAPEAQAAAVPAALAAGALVWPPGRHRHRAAYRGTIWTVKMGLFLVFTAMLGQAVGGFVVGFLTVLKHGPTAMSGLMTPTMVLAATISTLATASLAVWILRLRGMPWWALGLQWRELPASLWLGVQAALALAGLKLVYFKFLQTLGVWQLAGAGVVQAFFMIEDAREGLLGMLLGAVLVPVAEEILFRGVLFSALRRRSGPVPAVLISSAVFGLCHAPDLVFPGLLGVAFAILYHRTGSLWAPIGAHMLVNGVTLVLSYHHGLLITRLSWAEIGAIVLVAAALQLVSVLIGSRRADAPCLCENGGNAEQGRCPECCYPVSPWPRALSATLSVLSVTLLLAIGGLAIGVSWFLFAPYEKGKWQDYSGTKYALLHGTDEAAASRFVAAWAADRPDDPEVRQVLASNAYEREDFAEVVRLVEGRRAPDAPLTASEKNMMALALAELGKDTARAVTLGREAVAEAPGAAKPSYEDTLGWALLRDGA
jgi:membrane protease YdiL (CAAX protease family)